MKLYFTNDIKLPKNFNLKSFVTFHPKHKESENLIHKSFVVSISLENSIFRYEKNIFYNKNKKI